MSTQFWTSYLWRRLVATGGGPAVFERFVTKIRRTLGRPLRKIWLWMRRYAFRLRWEAFRDPPFVTRYQGFYLVYEPGDHSVMRYASAGEYEPLVMSYVRSVLKPNSIVVDVGANVGLFALNILDIAPSSFVHCFEPSPAPRRCLETTIMRNKLAGQIKLNGIVLSDKPETVDFYVHENHKSAYDGIRDTGWMGSAERTSMAATTLDLYLRRLNIRQVDLIKIDVEGAELLVLKGAVETLKICTPIVILEVAQVNLDAYGLRVEDVFLFFADHGYAMYGMDGLRLTFEQFRTATTEYEFVAVPPGHHGLAWISD
ncbi:MAG: FkbM family methyltransferase [Nitrospiraceae bacterium]